MDEVIAKSEILVDETERLEARKSGEDMIRADCEFNGIQIDEVTNEEAQELFGYPSAADYMDWFATLCERDLLTALLGYDLLIKEGKELTHEQYEAELEKNSQEANIPKEELSKRFTFEAFIRQTSSEYYNGLLENYAYNYIKEILQ